MNILFLSIGRLNDIEDRGIYTDLLREFRNNGHSVFIASPSEKRMKLKTNYTQKNGVHLLKIQIGNITKVNLLEKGISTITIERIFLRAIKKYFKEVKFDLVIYSTPPITFEKIISYIQQRDNAKTYLLLKDIFPQNAVDLKMFNKNSLVYKYFRFKEKRLYRQSDMIGCMSAANVKFILNNNDYISTNKVEICPNSIDPQNLDRDKVVVRKLKDKLNIPLNKTIFIYGGNLGKPQGIDFLIQCLRLNENNKNAYFIVVGAGTEFEKLENYFNIEVPKNSKLLSYLPKEEYDLLLKSCDVGMIFLDKRFTIPNFPSRILSYMEAAMPVLAATDINTDIGVVIEEAKFGYWCESNDVAKFNDKVKQLCDFELRKKMGANSRKYLEENYTVEKAYTVIMSHFE